MSTSALATPTGVLPAATVAGTAAARVAADRGVGLWLLGVSGAVFGMVVVGGVTRLTRSGLSMVDWRPQGSMLPHTDAQWAVEFDKYKQFPEYQKLNVDMSLEEFKRIYFMEWAHRMWGRGLGVVFGLPLIYFLARGRIQKLPGMASKMLALLCMGGSQGLVGWWMVKSGLEEPATEFKEPRVSPYRLTAHLVMALGIYSGLLWTGLSALSPNALPLPALPAKAAEAANVVRRVRGLGLGALVLAGVTFVSGAFVAGNDAGRAYNDWPLYAGAWVPAELWDASLQPAWRNFCENTATVQFDHRNLAYCTLAATLSLFALAKRPGSWPALPRAAQIGLHSMAGMVTVQVLLGISTLMMFVPVSLGSLHQAGALTLWTTMLYTQHALRFLRP